MSLGMTEREIALNRVFTEPYVVFTARIVVNLFI